MEDQHILYLEIDHKTEIKTCFVDEDEDSKHGSQGNITTKVIIDDNVRGLIRIGMSTL